MPTDVLAFGVDIDRFAAAAMAEIEVREGYEGELKAALAQCTAKADN
jgi:vacuolar-type H+-ATPase subunit B/Vma2